MKIDKVSVVLLVWIGICSVLACVLPAMAGNQATQYATTLQAPAILICGQDSITDITGWTFTGIPGSVNDTPMNSLGELQDPNTAGKSVAILNNTGAVSYKIILHANEFNDTNVASVDNELYNITSTTYTPTTSQIDKTLSKNADKDTGETIDGNYGTKSLWLKLTFGNSAKKMAYASFSVLGET